MIYPPWYLTLNIITVWLLAEAYYLPPQGFHGGPWFVFMAYVVSILAYVLLTLNFSLWVFLNLQLWIADG